MIIVNWTNLALTPVGKSTELPDHAYHIHLEFGGWYSDKDIYLWWREYGNDKCRKIVTTKWWFNLKKVQNSLRILNGEMP